jgi:hypothetical protein
LIDCSNDEVTSQKKQGDQQSDQKEIQMTPNGQKLAHVIHGIVKQSQFPVRKALAQPLFQEGVAWRETFRAEEDFPIAPFHPDSDAAYCGEVLGVRTPQKLEERLLAEDGGE